MTAIERLFGIWTEEYEEKDQGNRSRPMASRRIQRKYWSDLKKKLISEGYNQLSEKIGQLKWPAVTGNPARNTKYR